MAVCGLVMVKLLLSNQCALQRTVTLKHHQLGHRMNCLTITVGQNKAVGESIVKPGVNSRFVDDHPSGNIRSCQTIFKPMTHI